MQQFRNQHVLILGLGISGLAMARWCSRMGAQVTVADSRKSPPQLQTLRDLVPTAVFKTSAFDASLLQGEPLSAVLRSPGLAPALIAPVLEAALAKGCLVSGELTLFSLALAQLRASTGYAPKVLGITGTNGKTTVTALTGQLIERAGKTVQVAGNIGPSLLDTLSRCLDNAALPEVWVIELSSFQLDCVSGFEPTAATVLNMTQDHLDWHGGMHAYAAAKAKVFGGRGVMILNRDDPLVMGMRPADATGRASRPVERDVITFGGNMPERSGDYGIEVVNGMAWLVRAMDSNEPRRRGKDAGQALHIQHMMPSDALRIRGRHNAVNALAALALAGSAGCGLAPMLHGLRAYRGEPHRVEPIGIVRDVAYFDDSKGTNVGATEAALRGLGQESKVVVILGGEGKGQDFTPLAQPLTQYGRAAVLIGRDAPLIREALADAGVPLFDAISMHDAVLLASQQAVCGDVVLMSPACASFDMFSDYEHRARAFKDAVSQLAADAGALLESAP